MKQIIAGCVILFLLIGIACITYEYQPHYKKDIKENEIVQNIDVAENNDIGLEKEDFITNDIEDILSTYKEEDLEEFFDDVREDDYDFGDIEGDYREKIVEFYQNGTRYQTWKILNEYAQVKNIVPEKDGKDRVYYKLELVYIVPKSSGYMSSIIQNYDGTLQSIQNYVDVMYATSNIQIFKETDYVSIDENFYEFLIMECNLEKRYSETIVMQDYQITLDRNPY